MAGEVSAEAPIRSWGIQAIAKFVVSNAGELPEFLPLLKDALEALMVAEKKVELLKDLVREFYRQKKREKRRSNVSDENVVEKGEIDNTVLSGEDLKNVEVPKKRKHRKSTSEVPVSEQSADQGLDLPTENIIINTFVGCESGETSETPSTLSAVSFKTPKKKKKRDLTPIHQSEVTKVQNDGKIQTGCAMSVEPQSPMIRVIPSSRLMAASTGPSPEHLTSKEQPQAQEAGSEPKSRVYFEFDSEDELITSDGLAAALEELELRDFEILSTERAGGITTSTVEFASRKFYRVFFSKQLIVNGFVAKIRTCGTAEEVKVNNAERGSASEAGDSQTGRNDPAAKVETSKVSSDSLRVNDKDEVPLSDQRHYHVAERLNRISKEHDRSRRRPSARESNYADRGRSRGDDGRRRNERRNNYSPNRIPDFRSGRNSRQSRGEKIINRCFSELPPEKSRRRVGKGLEDNRRRRWEEGKLKHDRK